MRLPVAVIIYAVSAALAVTIVVGTVMANRYADLVSVYFGQTTQKVVSADGESAEYFSSEFASTEQLGQHVTEVATDIAREGITLLENDGALPLASGARVSVFGQDSVDPVYGGGGAGSVDTSRVVDLQTGITDAGIEINPTLRDFYVSGPGKDYRKTTPDVYGEGAFAVNEVPAAVYTEEVKASFADYGDAAIVVIGRSGGESSDLASTPDASGSTYLQLTSDEKDMLTLADDAFDRVIVLLNTQNPLELGFLEEYQVNAALWVGAFGQTGATAVGEVLTGVVNPSGALVDTYAYDSLGAPSMANLGSYSITNSEVDRGDTYIVYSEGVYVGYQYYETRYEDVVLGAEDAANFDYSTQVQYPFGFGGSYTSFAWSDFSVSEGDDGYTATVTVTNTGEQAGKEIVQIYLQSPYTDYDRVNGIEKPAVELAGFAKTSELEAGATETVTVPVPKESLKVYDASGAGTYIVDAGDYYLAAGQDSHDALNNVLAAKGKSTADGMSANGDAELAQRFTRAETDTTTYSVSQATGAAISNQFDDVDIRAYDPDFRYLSRNDWSGTWPSTYADGAWTAPEDALAALEISFTENADAAQPTVGAVDDEYGELSTATLVGEDPASPLWDTLVEQASVEELDLLVRVGGYATQTVESMALPGTVDKDGPAGISDTLVGGDSGMGYPPPIVLASTWNTDLAEAMGAAVGEESLDLGVTGWYAPAMNIHRSPYSGRNFEYYSEDATLSGEIGAGVVSGAQSKGVLVFIKHMALNDQETNRIGGSIFTNEQAMRELYLAPFETSVRDADARGVMAGLNRIGMRWAGGHAGLLTETLRGEWGFNGVVVTDQASFDVFVYEDLREGLQAGTDLWLNTDADLWALPEEEMTPTVVADMQRAARNIVFAVAHSNAMNGLAADSEIVRVTPLWQWGLYALDAVLGLLVLLTVFFTTRALLRGRRASREQPAAQ
ncbi:glycoside hydrolase family 3 C-terminal domain-containing protein [Rathayibacter sp. VKM Ac-2835]|nr:glycoside hydrolase family 3 C-terminal domain-containing protein [Rathayibacter sp. VKM Ac-2835]